jgi:hypothetical protein
MKSNFSKIKNIQVKSRRDSESSLCMIIDVIFNNVNSVLSPVRRIKFCQYGMITQIL